MDNQVLAQNYKEIKEIKSRIEKIKNNSLGIQAIEANTQRILASLKMLEINLECLEDL